MPAQLGEGGGREGGGSTNEPTGVMRSLLAPRFSSSKTVLSSVLAEVLFVLFDAVASTEIIFPSHHSGLGKGLDKFMSDLIRVYNYCSYKLSNDIETCCFLKLGTAAGELRLVDRCHSDRTVT